jgi:hypothetical protein
MKITHTTNTDIAAVLLEAGEGEGNMRKSAAEVGGGGSS